MEAAAVGETPYPYHGEGDDVSPAGSRSSSKSSPERGGGAQRRRGRGSAASAVAAGKRAPLHHLRRSPPVPGDLGRVFINQHQYFADVPAIAWSFHIGGYQPAQKWLKDRRGRALSWDDVGHYQKIVKVLAETDRIMREIELPLD